MHKTELICCDPALLYDVYSTENGIANGTFDGELTLAKCFRASLASRRSSSTLFKFLGFSLPYARWCTVVLS